MDFINVEVDSRLVNRFDIQDGPLVQRPFFLSRVVVPITDFDSLMKTVRTPVLYNADPGGTGVKIVYTVPSGKRIHLLSLWLYRSAGATLTTSKLGFTSGVSGDTIAYYSNWGAVSEHYERFVVPVTLNEGATIHVEVAAYLAGNTLEVRSMHLEEDAY